MKRKIDDLNNNEISNILKKSKSLREAISLFGYSTNGSGGYSMIKGIFKKIKHSGSEISLLWIRKIKTKN